MLARKHEVLPQATKQLNNCVLLEETGMLLLSFPPLVKENLQCLFHICASEYLQHYELDKSFFISTGIAYVHFEVFCPLCSLCPRQHYYVNFE